MIETPSQRPSRPQFCSGPCAKRPGWTPDALGGALLGRSHRSKAGGALLRQVIELQKKLLQIPSDYRVAIVPASDTGAMEMVLWSMLGARGVDVLSWESFGSGWADDVRNQLRLEDARFFGAPYGKLPALDSVDWSRDVVFTWNGTTSGVRVPDGDWIDPNREGLAICDATSAVFAMDLPWTSLDVVTWSWQKVLGGEAAHGILVLSPRAVERLETYSPPWPLPKLFRMTEGGKLIESLFEGSTINTPSMLCVEDALDALKWVQAEGGISGTKARVEKNFAVIDQWVQSSSWVSFLAREPTERSPTSVSLSIISDEFLALDESMRKKFVGHLTNLLEERGAAYDIKAYKKAPPGLRIWCGATVDAADLHALTLWLDWAYQQSKADLL